MKGKKKFIYQHAVRESLLSRAVETLRMSLRDSVPLISRVYETKFENGLQSENNRDHEMLIMGIDKDYFLVAPDNCENLGQFHALCKVRKLESSGFETVKEAEVDN